MSYHWVLYHGNWEPALLERKDGRSRFYLAGSEKPYDKDVFDAFGPRLDDHHGRIFIGDPDMIIEVELVEENAPETSVRLSKSDEVRQR